MRRGALFVLLQALTGCQPEPDGPSDVWSAVRDGKADDGTAYYVTDRSGQGVPLDPLLLNPSVGVIFDAYDPWAVWPGEILELYASEADYGVGEVGLNRTQSPLFVPVVLALCVIGSFIAAAYNNHAEQRAQVEELQRRLRLSEEQKRDLAQKYAISLEQVGAVCDASPQTCDRLAISVTLPPY